VQVAGPLAVLATVGAVTVGVLAASPDKEVLASSSAGAIGTVDLDRASTVSRSQSRALGRQSMTALNQFQQEEAAEEERRATQRAIRDADTRLWTTTLLNLWTDPSGNAEKVGLLEGRKKVLVTGREAAGRVEVVIEGKSRWVTAGYLDEEKPEPEPKPEPEDEAEDESSASEEAGVGGACTNGTSVSGQPNVIAVHQAVCSIFPEITSYGTYRDDGEHAQGLAVDIMVSGDTGWEVAEYVRANYAELGVNYVIYSQQIWSVDRASEGWRYMEDRGSTTANHYDHVHVTTY
jgi:hypothetical protein